MEKNNNESRCTEAIEFLSQCLWPFDSKQKIRENAEFLIHNANPNNGEDMYYVAYVYHNAVGVKTNYFKAFQAAQQSAKCGYARAYYVLGHMYRKGNGVVRDAEKAFILFKQGMDMGDEYCFDCYNSMLKCRKAVDVGINASKNIAPIVKEILNYIPKSK